ncbi:MAG TPA: ECF transporter S component [Spirochaetales bacterium]|nr:ECF transporter S component [Spirochaetales bacterium]
MAERNSWKLNEIVVLVILSIAIGILFWGWTFLQALASPLKPLGLDYVFAGVWFMGGTLVPYLIRRRGSALAGEVLAAALEGFITQWGITALIWGLVQGLGSELVFAATKYKRWDQKTLILAGGIAGIFSYILDFFYSQYWTLQPWIWPIQLICIVAGGAFWAGFVAYRIGKGIQKTGVTANLLSGEEGTDE